MPVAAFLVSAAAFLSAFLGGFVALRAVSHVGMIIAIGAGIRIGAAFFDLIPEAVGLLGGNLDQVMVATAFGFLAFYAIEKLTTVHVGHEAAAELDHGDAAHRHVGVIGASGMSIHSFLDGVALATGLVVGGGLGLVIAVVVVIHRFSDGISVVSLLLASHTPRPRGLPLGRDRRDRAGPRRPARAGRHDPGRGARGPPGRLRGVLPVRGRGRAAARSAPLGPVALGRRRDAGRRGRHLRLLGLGGRDRVT